MAMLFCRRRISGSNAAGSPVDASVTMAINGSTPSAPAKASYQASYHCGCWNGVVYTTFHFPESGANVITTENSDWATNCPEYKVTAVQVTRVSQPSEWQRRFQAFSARQQKLLDAADTAITAPRG